jgi:MFS family permease
LIIGLVLLIGADLVLGMSNSVYLVGFGVVLWGLHMGFTQGLLSAMVADTAPADLRGTAFGMFNLITGIALLLASTLAGLLWQAYGPDVTFFVGAGFAIVSLAGFLVLGRSTPPTSA